MFWSKNKEKPVLSFKPEKTASKILANREQAHLNLRSAGITRPRYTGYFREAFVDHGVLFHKVCASTGSIIDRKIVQVDIFTTHHEADDLVDKMNKQVSDYFDAFETEVERIKIFNFGEKEDDHVKR